MTTQQDIPGRSVYIVSDGTGITAEALARSVLSQFNLTFSRIHIPFVDTLDKVRQAKDQIQAEHDRTGQLPIVFSTLVIPELVAELRKADALHLDVIQTFGRAAESRTRCVTERGNRAIPPEYGKPGVQKADRSHQLHAGTRRWAVQPAIWMMPT